MKPGPPHGAWWAGGAVFLNYCALCSSCVSPGGTGGQKLAQLPELASAEISLHAIYLHQVSGWGERPWVKCRVRGGLERKDLPGRSWRRRLDTLRTRPPGREGAPSVISPLFSSISSSSRNCGARLQPPPCPGPGPAPRKHSHRMRRSHPGQVTVRPSGCAGDRPRVNSRHHGTAQLMAFLTRLQSCLQPQTAVENPENPESVPWRVSGNYGHPEGAWPGR